MLPPDVTQPDWGQPLQDQSQPPQEQAPTVQDIQDRAQRLLGVWNPRDVRMDDDQNLYDLTDAASGGPTTIVRNIPQVTVEKVSNMIGGHIPTTELVPAPEGMPVKGKADSLLRFMWDEWDRRWRGPGHSGLRHDMAHYLALRGWLALRIQYDPNVAPDEIPLRLYLIDPRDVYIQPNDDGFSYVVHRVYMFIGEVVDRWKEAAPSFQGRQLDERVEVISYYDDQFYGVLVDALPVVPPQAHNYGFCPWVVVTAGGTPARGSGQQGQGTQWTANVGPSIFNGIKYAYASLNRVLSQLAGLVAKADNPPVLVHYSKETGLPEEIDLSYGATNYLIEGKEDLKILNNSPSPGDVAPLLAALNDDIYMGSIPKVLWGGADAGQSGLAIALLSGAAKDALFGIISSLEFAEAQISKYAIRLLRDFHTQPVGIVAKDANGNWVTGETLTPEELRAIGTRVTVTYQDVSPKDRFQLAQLAIALVKESLISLETAREQYLGLDNPDLEETKVRKELALKDPDMVKDALMPLALKEADPKMFEIWAALQQLKQAPPPPPGAPPGLPGLPGQGPPVGLPGQGPPPGLPAPPGAPPVPSLAAASGTPPVPGQPPTLLPPQLGVRPFNPFQQALGAAQGAAGARRLPGVAGAGGIVPGGAGIRR